MMSTDKAETVKQFIVTEMAPPGESVEFDDTDSLIEIIDSLGVMKLITFLEESFRIKIGAADLLPDNFDTVTAIVSLLEKQQA